MPELILTDTFLQSMRRLDHADAKRVGAFVEKLLHAPEASGFRPEIVHDAHDRSIRSLHVTHDLRAIARLEGERVALLHVDRHDRAYEWAKARCVTCVDDEAGLELAGAEPPEPPAEAGHACRDDEQLCRLLGEHALSHALS